MRTNAAAAAPLHAIATTKRCCLVLPSQASNLPNNSMGKKSAEEKSVYRAPFHAWHFPFNFKGKHFFSEAPCIFRSLLPLSCPEARHMPRRSLFTFFSGAIFVGTNVHYLGYTGNHILLLIITKLWGTQVLLFCLNVHVLLCLGWDEGIIMLLLYSHTLGSHNFSAPRQKKLDRSIL